MHAGVTTFCHKICLFYQLRCQPSKDHLTQSAKHASQGLQWEIQLAGFGKWPLVHHFLPLLKFFFSFKRPIIDHWSTIRFQDAEARYEGIRCLKMYLSQINVNTMKTCIGLSPKNERGLGQSLTRLFVPQVLSLLRDDSIPFCPLRTTKIA